MSAIVRITSALSVVHSLGKSCHDEFCDNEHLKAERNSNELLMVEVLGKMNSWRSVIERSEIDDLTKLYTFAIFDALRKLSIAIRNAKIPSATRPSRKLLKNLEIEARNVREKFDSIRYHMTHNINYMEVDDQDRESDDPNCHDQNGVDQKEDQEVDQLIEVKGSLIMEGCTAQGTSCVAVNNTLDAEHSPIMDVIDAKQLVELNNLKLSYTHKINGSGGYSNVYAGKYGNEIVAVKMLKKKQRKNILVEAKLMKLYEHDYVVKIIGYCTHPKSVIVMERMHISLETILHKKGTSISYFDRLIWMRNIASALEFLHLQGVVHQDVKPANILINECTKIAKLGDFGAAVEEAYTVGGVSFFSDAHFGPVFFPANASGTYLYQSSETRYGALGPTRSGDVYSFGVTVWECLTRKRPEDVTLEKFELFLSAEYQANHEEKSDFHILKETALKCLSPIHLGRPTASQVRILLSSLQTSQNTETSKSTFKGTSIKREWRRLYSFCMCSIIVLLLSLTTLFCIWKKTNWFDKKITKCFETREELRTSIYQYVNGNKTVWDMYGDVIGDWCVSKITNMSYIFSLVECDCRPAPLTSTDMNLTSFNQEISSWDVSQVTDMTGMFYDCKDFNQDISRWDVSRVTDMNGMFHGARNFDQDISSWNVGRVTNIFNMFYNATFFNQDLSLWDVSKVTNMDSTFEYARAFEGDIAKWDVSLVLDMSNMFGRASNFNGNLSIWNVSSVKNMSCMFLKASVFNQNLSLWDVSQVITMQEMFSSTDSFNGDITTWNVSNVNSMEMMFFNAEKFNQDLSQWNVTQVNSMSKMFSSASSFAQNLCGWGSKLDIQTSIDDMFTSSSCLYKNTAPFIPSGPFCEACS